MKKSLNMKKGFTLIELLVVVAIIGTLTAVVLIGVNNGRRAGRDAAIQTALNQALTQVQVYATQNGGNYQNATSQLVVSTGTTYGGITNTTAKVTIDNGGEGIRYSGTASNFSISSKISSGKHICISGTSSGDISAISTVDSGATTAGACN